MSQRIVPSLRVRTASGTEYLVDPILGYLTRVPDTHPATMPFEGAELRRDGTWLHLLETPTLQVGRPAEWVLEPLDPRAAFTVRTTTPVVAIDYVPILLAEAHTQEVPDAA